MRRGQLAVDFLLAIAVALVFFSVYTAFLQGQEGNVEEASVRSGLKAILLDTYGIVSSARANGAEVVYASPPLKIAQEPGQLECSVSITPGSGGSSGMISVASGGITESYAGLHGLPQQTFECGDTVTISP